MPNISVPVGILDALAEAADILLMDFDYSADEGRRSKIMSARNWCKRASDEKGWVTNPGKGSRRG
jgi:hypothetical protein